METVTASDIKAFAKEFEGENDTRIELFVEYATAFVNENKWGRKYKLALILIACHLLTLGDREGNGGPVTAESVGELSRSYGQTTGSEDPELASTSYGQQFLSLRKTLVITPLIV